jgi:hypothetical protein
VFYDEFMSRKTARPIILSLLFFILTCLAWDGDNLSAYKSSPSDHIPVIPALSLWQSLAMGMIYMTTMIYFSSLQHI